MCVRVYGARKGAVSVSLMLDVEASCVPQSCSRLQVSELLAWPGVQPGKQGCQGDGQLAASTVHSFGAILHV